MKKIALVLALALSLSIALFIPSKADAPIVAVPKLQVKSLAFPIKAWIPETGKAYAKYAISEYDWDNTQYNCLIKLWTRESNWRWKAKSPTSDFGIPQRHMRGKSQEQISEFLSDPMGQIDWGLGYIKARYETPCKALAFSNRKNWY